MLYIAFLWAIISFLVEVPLFIYLFGVLRRFQHCTGHITTGSLKGRGNQYIQFIRVLYCKYPTNGKQLPAFPTRSSQKFPKSINLCHFLLLLPCIWNCMTKDNDKQLPLSILSSILCQVKVYAKLRHQAIDGN